jgi:hypothetical protein
MLRRGHPDVPGRRWRNAVVGLRSLLGCVAARSIRWSGGRADRRSARRTRRAGAVERLRSAALPRSAIQLLAV